MVSLVVAAALTQTIGTSDFKSPPLGWLRGEQIYWTLRPVCFRVICTATEHEFQKRFVEFRLQDISKSIGPDEFNGQFNFWSPSRLKSLGLLGKSASARLRRHQVAMLHESSYLSCLVPLNGSDYILYVQLAKPSFLPKSKEIALRRVLSEIRVK